MISNRIRHHRFGRRTPAALLLCTTLALAACSSDDDAPPAGGGDADPAVPGGPGDDAQDGGPLGGDSAAATLAFVSGATPGFETGQIERLSLGERIVSTGRTPATGSDIRVATDGTDVYEIGRLTLDTLTRFTPEDLQEPRYQYSVNGSESAANPYSAIFVSDTKAYLTRRGSPLLWIIDPSAATEANFLLNTIDLGAYDTDARPEMTDALLVDDELYVLMERLDEGFAPVQNGYLAVIDTLTDTEIDTGEGLDGLRGIALETSNPTGLQYLPESDEIYVVGRGNIFGDDTVPGDPYNGGIEVIDPETYRNEILLDDGTQQDNQGFFADALIVSSTKGYVLTYADFRVTTLRSFNPLTGLLDEAPVGGLSALDISVLALDPQGRLWVGINTADGAGFRLLDPSDDSVLVENVPTEFNPNGIVFIEQPDTRAPGLGRVTP